MQTEAILLTLNEAAARIGISPWTLKKWRGHGIGPKFVRLGGKLGPVRYRPIDLDIYVSGAVVDPSA